MEKFHRNTFILFGICLISLLQECHSKPEIQIPLENTAGQVGNSINLYVKAKKYLDSDYLAFFYDPGEALEIWAENDPDTVIDPAKFGVEFTVYDDPTDGTAKIGEYNLTIFADTTLGLKYRAHFLLDTDVFTTSDVVVLESLQCPAEGQEKDEDQEIMIMCDTYYYGYKVPTMKWYNWNGEVPGNVIVIDEENNHVSATVNITAAGEHDEMTFYCRLTFEPDVDETIPVPDFTTECTTFYYVKHGASNIVTYPDPDNFPQGIIQVYEGNIINCSADGRPEPGYVWYYDDGVPSEGQNLLIDSKFLRNGESVYARCVATNSIDGQPREAEKEINFVANEAVPTGPPASAGTKGWVIAIAVIIPLLVIGVIVVLIYFFKIRKGSDSGHKQKPVPTSDPFDAARHHGDEENVKPAAQPRSQIYKPPANQGLLSSEPPVNHKMGHSHQPYHEPTLHPVNYPETYPTHSQEPRPVPKARNHSQQSSHGPPPHQIISPSQNNPPVRKSVPAGIPLPHMGQLPHPPNPAPRPRTPAEPEFIPEDTVV